MKKFSQIFVALLAMSALSFAFIACSSDDSSDSRNNSGSQTANSQPVSNGKWTVMYNGSKLTELTDSEFNAKKSLLNEGTDYTIDTATKTITLTVSDFHKVI